MEKAITKLDITPEEAIDELAAIRMQEIEINNVKIQDIPKPTKTGKNILKKLSITLPKVFWATKADVHSKKKLSK